MQRPARRAAFLAVLFVVALLHAAGTRELADRMIDIDSNAMPERIAVAYVRTIDVVKPPGVAPLAAAPAAPPAPAARTPRRPKRAASAVDDGERLVADAAQPAASAPDTSVEPAAIAAAASAAEPARDRTAASEPAASAVASATAPADAASSPVPGAFDWPASTRVSYVLTGNYRGEVSGQAQVEWVRLGARYQVNLDLSVGPQFAPIISRRMTSEGRIDESGLVPDRYDEDTQIVFRDRRRMSVVFEPDVVVLANGQRRQRLPGVQDTASQFIQLMYRFATQPDLLRVGGSIDIPLAVPRGMDSWTYDVVEEQLLDTPFGLLPAFHLVPRRPGRKNGELTAEIWIAPELRYLPVRIRIEQDAATFLDLMIAKKPEMAAQ